MPERVTVELIRNVTEAVCCFVLSGRLLGILQDAGPLAPGARSIDAQVIRAEAAVNGGSAAVEIGLERGEEVYVER